MELEETLRMFFVVDWIRELLLLYVKDELLGITCLSLTLSRVLVSAKLKLNDILLLDQVIYECFLN